MTFLACIAVAIAALIGLGAKFALDKMNEKDGYGEALVISWPEFASVALVMALIIVPATLVVGKKLSVANIVTYEQFLNGAQTQVHDDVVTCYGGHSGSSASAGQSNCQDTYISGSYSWEESYTVQVCSGSGTGRSCHSETRYRTEYADIYTPYATREHTYSIDSSFGFKANKSYTFPGVYLDANPAAYGGRSIPANLYRGAPKEWITAKQRIAAGNPLPVTALASYDNYILASHDEAIKAYSNNIDQYQKAKLLPDFAAGIMTNPVSGAYDSQARKVAFVGVTPKDEQAWQDSVMQFNAAFGTKLQGDLHVVIVNDTKVSASDAVPYLNALKAYWQGPHYAKRAIAKNAVILVLGTDGTKVSWAQATTGMPNGNELMAQYVHDNLPGTALTPQAIFGSPRTVIHGKKATVSLGTKQGVFENIAFTKAPFARASMSCDSKDDTCVGYKDMVDTIQPKTSQKVVMLVITSVIALALWFLVAATSFVDRGVARLSGRPMPVRSYNSYRF